MKRITAEDTMVSKAHCLQNVGGALFYGIILQEK